MTEFRFHSNSVFWLQHTHTYTQKTCALLICICPLFCCARAVLKMTAGEYEWQHHMVNPLTSRQRSALHDIQSFAFYPFCCYLIVCTWCVVCLIQMWRAGEHAQLRSTRREVNLIWLDWAHGRRTQRCWRHRVMKYANKNAIVNRTPVKRIVSVFRPPSPLQSFSSGNITYKHRIFRR